MISGSALLRRWNASLLGGVFGRGHHGDTLHAPTITLDGPTPLAREKSPKHFEADLRCVSRRKFFTHPRDVRGCKTEHLARGEMMN